MAQTSGARGARKGFGLVWGLVLLGCGSDPKPQAQTECPLDKDTRFLFTEVERAGVGTLSNANCPVLKPENLNSQLDAGAEACSVEVTDCVASVSCEFLGFPVTGSVAQADKGFEGRFRIDEPIVCVYDVKADTY
jgi:hypothetical protein